MEMHAGQPLVRYAADINESPITINASPPSAVYTRRWTESVLVQL